MNYLINVSVFIYYTLGAVDTDSLYEQLFWNAIFYMEKKIIQFFIAVPFIVDFLEKKNPALKLPLATTIETFRVIMKFGEKLSSFFHLKITRFQNISCFPENSWALLTLFYWFYLFFNTIFSQLIYLCYWGIEPTALSFTTAFVPSHYGWHPTCSHTSGISRHCWWCDWRCVKSITVLNISNNSENYMFMPNKHGDLKHPISGGSLKREENTGHIYRGRQGTKKWGFSWVRGFLLTGHQWPGFPLTVLRMQPFGFVIWDRALLFESPFWPPKFIILLTQFPKY